MIYSFNPKEIENEGISINSFLYVLSVYLERIITNDDIQNALSKRLITYSSSGLDGQPLNVRITEEGVKLIDRILINSEFKAKPEDNTKYDKIAEAIIPLFPKGMKKVGSKEYPWRESKAVIAHRLKLMVKKFTADFTFEEAVDATKRYIESFHGDYTTMRTMPYFLWKKDNETGMFTSDFLRFIENKDAESKQSYDSGELV